MDFRRRLSKGRPIAKKHSSRTCVAPSLLAMAPKKQSRKRPAASISSVEPPPAAPPAAPPAWVEEQLADASQVEIVEWAMHMVMLLFDDLKATAAKMGRNGTINLWCDFAGTASEAFAARQIEEVLTANGIFQDIQFRVYLACDNDTSCREFIKVTISQGSPPTMQWPGTFGPAY